MLGIVVGRRIYHVIVIVPAMSEIREHIDNASSCT